MIGTPVKIALILFRPDYKKYLRSFLIQKLENISTVSFFPQFKSFHHIDFAKILYKKRRKFNIWILQFYNCQMSRRSFQGFRETSVWWQHNLRDYKVFIIALKNFQFSQNLQNLSLILEFYSIDNDVQSESLPETDLIYLQSETLIFLSGPSRYKFKSDINKPFDATQICAFVNQLNPSWQDRIIQETHEAIQNLLFSTYVLVGTLSVLNKLI